MLNRTIHGQARPTRATAGFTLIEILVASSIAVVVATVVMKNFIWCVQESTLSAKISWSQKEAISTADKLTMYMKNASEIVGIDTNEGTWVNLRFPDGTFARLAYSNAIPLQRDGRLYLQRTNGTELIVARGLTKVQDTQGFTTPVFLKTRDNLLRVSYRVSEPARSGGHDENDGLYAANVCFAVCLRNVEEE
jgi:prepilin-type N-terminal cleavage/methylation domain-containing protein